MIDVIAERRRQVTDEGFVMAGDDGHQRGDMARAAAVYALTGSGMSPPVGLWPWSLRWFKPKGPRRDLVRAGALILAEIERLDRAAVNS